MRVKQLLRFGVVAGVGMCGLPATNALADDPYRVMWMRQFGAVQSDYGRAIAVLSDGAVMAGGEVRHPQFGAQMWRIRYDHLGDSSWYGVQGTSGVDDLLLGIAAADNGNAITTGLCAGDFFGPPAGLDDAFVAKSDLWGLFVWKRQYGTSGNDASSDVAIDGAGFILTTGYVEGEFAGPHAGGQDIYLAKFDASGQLVWGHQIGTPASEHASGVAIGPSGTAYIAGLTSGDLAAPSAGGADCVLAKCSITGQLLWTRQWGGAGNDEATSVVVDAQGDVYVVGTTGAAGSLGADIQVSKFDASGNLAWSRTYGGVGDDLAADVALYPSGGVVIAGAVSSAVFGVHKGSTDAVLFALDPEGTLRWSKQFGTPSSDELGSVAAGPLGSFYASGSTSGALVPPSGGGSDFFNLKIGPLCPPDLTAHLEPQSLGYGEPDGIVTNDDFFYFLARFAAGHLAVADRTTTAVPGQPGYGVPNGVINNDDFFFYLNEFVTGC